MDTSLAQDVLAGRLNISQSNSDVVNNQLDNPRLAGSHLRTPELAISQLGANVRYDQSANVVIDQSGSSMADSQLSPDVVENQLESNVVIDQSSTDVADSQSSIDVVKSQLVQSIQSSPITIQSLCIQQAEDSEADHLVQLVRSRVVTRKDAKMAVRGEDPLVDETAQGLIKQILKYQGLDPWCIKLKKNITSSKREGHYKDYFPQQKSLIYELLSLYHDDQLAGHWGVQKTEELLELLFY